MMRIKYTIIILLVAFLASLVSISLLSVLEHNVNYKIESVLQNKASYAKVMDSNYYIRELFIPTTYFIENYSNKIDLITNIFPRDDYQTSARLKYPASIISTKAEASVIIYAIEMQHEYFVFPKMANVVAGVLLTDETEPYSAMIGWKLAEYLNIEVEDKIILRLIGADDFYRADEYKVVGIIETGNNELDEKSIVMPLNSLWQLANIRNSVSEINIKPTDTTSSFFLNDKYEDEIVSIFGEDVRLYSLQDEYPHFLDYKQMQESITKYIFGVFYLILFSFCLFVNARMINLFKGGYFIVLFLLNVALVSLGFALSVILAPAFSKYFLGFYKISTDKFIFSFESGYYIFLTHGVAIAAASCILIFIYSKLFIKDKNYA